MSIVYPKHYHPKELLDRATFTRFGAQGLRYFRPGILKAADWFWENYPTRGRRCVLVNTWANGGTKEYRGLRLPASSHYTDYSAHSWGGGIDMVPLGITPEEARAWIKDQHAQAVKSGDPAEIRPVLYIRRMENGTPSWVHIDCLEHDKPEIWMVNP